MTIALQQKKEVLRCLLSSTGYIQQQSIELDAHIPRQPGESDYDKPRILEIAEVVQNMDVLDEGKKKQDKAIKKGKEAELQARKLQVSLNEVR